MKKAMLIIIAVIMYGNTSAQMGINKKSADEVQELRQLPLLVVLQDEGQLNGYNENIKKAIEAIWTFSPSVKYITKDEWRAVSKNKDEAKKYAHLYYTEKMLGGNAPNNNLLIGLLKKTVVTHFVFTPNVGLADLMFSLKNLQEDLEIGNDYKNLVEEQTLELSKYLKDSLALKTLYIDEGFVSKKLLKQIDEIYAYKYKLVSKEEIDKAIVNKEPDILFIRHIIMAERPLTKEREDFATGKMVQKTGSMNFPLKLVFRSSDLKVVGGTGAGEKIEEKDIERFLKLMNN